MENNIDVIIIGAGASGLFCAIECSKFAKVVLLEANDRVGKKILASGNGRCNLTNINLTYKEYNTNTVKYILDNYGTDIIRKKWLEYGLLTKVEEERVYPYSESSNSVLNILLNKINNKNIELQLSSKVEKIIKTNNGYIVKTNKSEYKSKYVVVACGSKATTGIESYNLLKELNHKITQLTPSLVALKSNDVVGANGVRCKAKCYVEIDNIKYPEEKGELLFKDGAISGVLAFRMSSYVARANKVGYKNALLHIDFVPEYSEEELANFIKLSYKPNTNILEGIFHKTIAKNIIAHTKMDRSLLMSDTKAISLAHTSKNYICNINGLMGLNNAQVVSGGVDIKDIDMKTMESKLNKNLFILGEMLDVDGNCGGFNLHWAWASALACSNKIQEVFDDKN